MPAGRRERVELVLRREIGGQPLAAGAVGAGDQLGELMVGLRPNDQVHGRLAAHDLLALGLGDAAGDGDGHAGSALGDLRLAHLLQLAELGIDLLGGLLADVAGVEHHQVRALRPIGHGIAQRRQHVGHPLAVIDVHLTAVGLDKEALGGRGRGHGWGYGGREEGLQDFPKTRIPQCRHPTVV